MSIMKFVLLLFFIFANSLICDVFISGTGSNGNVGDTICNSIIIQSENPLEKVMLIEGIVQLSNPLVFYPLDMLADSDFEIIENNINRENDSIYKIRLKINIKSKPVRELKINFCGELLAGNDSVCSVNFTNVQINFNSANDFEIDIKSYNLGSKFPYLRFARLLQNAPNPVTAGSNTNWTYTIDIPQNINFLVYNLVGKLMYEEKRKIESPGTHIYDLLIDNLTYPGIYYFILDGEYTRVGRSFVIIK